MYLGYEVEVDNLLGCNRGFGVGCFDILGFELGSVLDCFDIHDFELEKQVVLHCYFLQGLRYYLIVTWIVIIDQRLVSV